MNHNFNKAFTLVELIVVITILAVLATVAFISFQGYTSSSRDSVRLADLKNISKSFEINRTKGLDFPLPDKKVDISSSGTIFQYQGELSQNILNSDLNIFDGGVDPLTGENYGYAVNAARNKFQVIGFLENGENIANISLNKTFADNSDKYVKSSGDTLGILLDPTTNEIITDENNTLEIDLQTNTNSYAIVRNILETGDDEFISSALAFRYINNYSCYSILESGNSKGSGLYTINPSGEAGSQIEVFCDMKTDGGGWTLNARSHPNSTACSGNFGWMKNCGTPNDFSSAYSLGLDDLPYFQEVLIGKQDINSNNFDTYAYKQSVTKRKLLTLQSFGLFEAGRSQPVLDQECYNDGSWKSMLDGIGYTDYSGFDNNDLFWMRDRDSAGSSGSVFGLSMNHFILYVEYTDTCRSGKLGTHQGLIFVR